MNTRMLNMYHLETVARVLRDMLDEVAFVGGATIGLYLDEVAAPDVRVTDDVDCVVEVASYAQFGAMENR